ncbi:hypothetical protein [Spirabiliibacterium falconis]|uniref:hypothetical protein n=1 Tax=Spirabiliibacterium falconis TaxID=572023 RepID=UPI001AAE0882|nr:hypothetical protein [Spirabiliibacterium falconis]MBE2895081.1 hypothetical protein [Spirabiliibacterium falconis]
MRAGLTALCCCALLGCAHQEEQMASSALVGEWVCPMTQAKQRMAQTDYVTFKPDGTLHGKGSFVYPMNKPRFRFSQTFQGKWRMEGNVVHISVVNASLERQHSNSTQHRLKTSTKWRAQEQTLFAKANAQYRSGKVDATFEVIDLSKREFSYVQYRSDQRYYGGCVRAHTQRRER